MKVDVGVGVGVGVGEDQDMGDSGLQYCINHPYKTNPGGICAFCLQEKLGKLVSSSFPLPKHQTSSSSSPPSLRSETHNTTANVVVAPANNASSASSSSFPDAGKAKIPFLLANKKKIVAANSSSSSSSDRAAEIVFKRSKSTAVAPRGRHLFEAGGGGGKSYREGKKRSGFWSFLYVSHRKSNTYKNADKVTDKSPQKENVSVGEPCTAANNNGTLNEEVVPMNRVQTSGSDSVSVSSMEQKVSRSRSVGCGSRSFSGDFFEKISTGFGDCALRRVESHREGKPKLMNNNNNGGVNGNGMREKVKCGGIFGGFIYNSSNLNSSSWLSSSNHSSNNNNGFLSYWVSSSTAADQEMNGNGNGRSNNNNNTSTNNNGRSSKSWGWALASPMRAFTSTKPSSGKREAKQPNLNAIPSLLTARS